MRTAVRCLIWLMLAEHINDALGLFSVKWKFSLCIHLHCHSIQKTSALGISLSALCKSFFLYTYSKFLGLCHLSSSIATLSVLLPCFGTREIMLTSLLLFCMKSKRRSVLFRDVRFWSFLQL